MHRLFYIITFHLLYHDIFSCKDWSCLQGRLYGKLLSLRNCVNNLNGNSQDEVELESQGHVCLVYGGFQIEAHKEDRPHISACACFVFLSKEETFCACLKLALLV